MTELLARVADLVDPPPVDAWTPIGYQPEPVQAEFHAIAAFAHGGPWDVLFGGAMGGGKTTALVVDAIRWCAQYPGLEAWIVRDTYRNLQRDIIAPQLEPIGFAGALGGRWNGSEYTLRFPNRSRIRFVYCRSVAEVVNVRGECQYLGLDERTLLDPEAVDHLTLRIRSGDDRVPVVGIRSGTNPGGIGHGRVKEEFIDPAPLGRQQIPIVDDETGQPLALESGRIMHRYFLPSTSADNTHLDDSYYARFGMMSTDARAAYRDGDWSRFEGMRFSAFDMRRHVVPAGQLDLPLGGIRRGLGVDWGSAAPFAAVWGAIVNEQLIVYRELHETGLTPREQAEQILAAEMPGERLPQRPLPVWIDPATWARSPEKPLAKPIDPDAPPVGSIAHGYRAAGVPVVKAYNDRVSGWALIDELLGELPDGRPRLVISDACPNVVRSLSGAPRSAKNPEDVDDGYRDDHAADAARYLVCGMFRRGMGGRRESTRGPRRPTGGRPVTAGLRTAGL